MTNEQFYNIIIKCNISADITAKARQLLETNARKTAPKTETKTVTKTTKGGSQKGATRDANLVIAKVIAEKLKDCGRVMGASEIQKAVAKEYPDISVPKISAVCKVAIESGILVKVEGYKVGGKGSAVNGYRVP